MSNVQVQLRRGTTAQHSLASITDSRYVKKNNMAFGTLTATYNLNLGSAVTIIDDGNSGGF